MKEKRRCYRCKIYKDLSMFDKDASRSSGIAYRCKECQSVITKKAFGKGSRFNTFAYRKDRLAKYNKKHPLKIHARQAVRDALKTGKILKLPCAFNNQSCDGRIEGHHPRGYSKKHQLDVEWLCNYHHKLSHK